MIQIFATYLGYDLDIYCFSIPDYRGECGFGKGFQGCCALLWHVWVPQAESASTPDMFATTFQGYRPRKNSILTPRQRNQMLFKFIHTHYNKISKRDIDV